MMEDEHKRERFISSALNVRHGHGENTPCGGIVGLSREGSRQKRLRQRKASRPARGLYRLGIGAEGSGKSSSCNRPWKPPGRTAGSSSFISEQEDFHSFLSGRTIPGEPPKEPEGDAGGGPVPRPGGTRCRKAREFRVRGFQRESFPRIRRILRWSGT